MSLHNTAEFMKRFGIAAALGLGGIIVLVIFFRIGVVVKDILFPPKIAPANMAYGKLAPIEFPQSTVDGNFTYSVDTLDGTLPEFPDRLIVYPVVNKPPSVLDLDNAKQKIAALRMVDNTGNPVPEIPRGGPSYEWDELTGLQRQIIFDIVSNDFTMSSQYLGSNTVLRANAFRNLKDETEVVPVAQGFLDSIGLLPSDIDLEKTNNPASDKKYTTKPQTFAIKNGELTPASSLSDSQIIRVDLYQKNVTYKFLAGKGTNLTKFQNFTMDMPIMYPNPPFSTMNFLIGSGANDLQVVSSAFTYQELNLKPEKEVTYPIKSAQEAFKELQDGKGYVASYNGSDSQILISDVFLAYYLGEKAQDYLMPVIVFEGPNGFFAYVSAIPDAALKQSQ